MSIALIVLTLLAPLRHAAVAQVPPPVNATAVAPGTDQPLNNNLTSVMSPDPRGPTGFRQVYAIKDAAGNTKYMRGSGGLYMVYDRGASVNYAGKSYMLTPPGATYVIGAGALQDAMGTLPGPRRGVNLVSQDAPQAQGPSLVRDLSAPTPNANTPIAAADSNQLGTAVVAVRGSKEPVATRGGVMLLALARLDQGAWPSTVDATTDDGRTITGTVAVLENIQDTRGASWTRAAQLARTTPMAAWNEAAAPETVGNVILLLETPIGFGGTLTVGQSLIQPRWESMNESATRGVAAFEPFALDTPDMGAPNDWFRAALIARARGQSAPEPQGTGADALFARHIAYLWMAGLDRLRAVQPSLEARALGLLTGVARGTSPLGKPLAIAAWLADGDEEGGLLDVMLDPGIADHDLATQVDGWMSTRLAVLAWVESDGGDQVTIGLANPLGEPQTVALEWLTGASQVQQELLAPNELRFVTIARSTPSSEIAGRLAVTVGYARTVLTVAPGVFAAVPPGLSLEQFLPAASLADVRMGRLPPVPGGWQTTASVRKTKDGWEVFIEALRPDVARGDVEDIVTVAIGPRPSTEVVVNCRGLVTDGIRNAPDASVPQVLAMEFTNRWRATVRIPASWIDTRAAGTRSTLSLGVSRSCRMTDLQCAGLPPLPWHDGPSMVQVDLATWPR